MVCVQTDISMQVALIEYLILIWHKINLWYKLNMNIHLFQILFSIKNHIFVYFYNFYNIYIFIDLKHNKW